MTSVASAHLPHAALRRCRTDRENDTLVQVEFSLEANEQGWRTLEFLARFVRDQARGDMNIQLRPFALPPVASADVQLGKTLKFHIDLFVEATPGEIAPVLASVLEVGQDLRRAISIYRGALFPDG